MLSRVSVIILNYNGLADTLHCLKSLENVNYPNFEVMVLDNGSSGNDAKILGECGIKNYRFIDNKKNLGFAGGCNRGIELTLMERRSEYVYLLNNDTEVDKEFLFGVVEVAERSEQIGIIASKSLYFDNRDIIENAGHYLLDCGDVASRGRGMRSEEFNKEEGLLSACGAGVLLRVSMLKEIGLFRDEFFLNYEDVDLCLRALIMGWKCIYAPKSIIYHKVSASISKGRSYELNLRAQVNQLKAYYYNIPMTVLLVNSPFVVLRILIVVIGGFIFLQLRMVRVFLHAHCKFFGEFIAIMQERKRLLPKKRVSSWHILKKQKNFLSVYFGYFLEIVLRRRKSVF